VARPEVERWMLQAEEELDAAKVSLNAGKLFAAAFWSQQATEKALKAAYIHSKKESPGPTHSLTFLGRELKIPEEYYGILRDLTKEYYMSRYPDASEDVPYKTYSREDAEKYVRDCERLMKWAKQRMQK